MADSTPAPKPAAIQLHISQPSGWRSYLIPFTRAQAFAVSEPFSGHIFHADTNQSFKTIVDELLLEEGAPLGENVPAAGDWTIFDDNGMVIKSRFWEDLVEPGSKLFITPRAHSALSPKHRGDEASSGGAGHVSDAVVAPGVTAVKLPLGSDLIDFNDDGPSIDGSQTGNSSSGLPSSSSTSLVSADYEFDGHDSWRLPRKAPSQASPKNPSPSSVKSASNLQYTQRDSNYKVIRTGTVPRTCTVTAFINGRLKGKPGSKIQLLRENEGRRGFSPGSTFMAGTQKTFGELNMGAHFQFVFTQAPRKR
jgi:hypothetical protein